MAACASTTAVLRMCQLVLPPMRAAGSGRIVNISSMGGRLTLPGGGVYHATKYAVEALLDALRFQVKGFGIEVAIIEPGLIRTSTEGVHHGPLGTPSARLLMRQRALLPYRAWDAVVATPFPRPS